MVILMKRKLGVFLVSLFLGVASFSEGYTSKSSSPSHIKTASELLAEQPAKTVKKTTAKPVVKTATKTKTTVKPVTKVAAKPTVKPATKVAAVPKQEINTPEYRSYLVGDKYGNILFGENMNEKYPLASTTKTMTMILTFEALKRGDVSLSDDVTISWEAARMGGAMIPIKAGEVWKLEDLIKATAIHSANNAAYAVAEHVGKGLDNFVKMMNDKAITMGIGDEVEFHTPAGLPPKMTKRGMDMGTAKGMYKIMLEAKNYPEYVAIAGTKNAKINNDTILLRSKNHLLGKQGIYGLKTGYHATSGYNILVMGEKDNLDLCFVVLGGRTAKIRDAKVLDLDTIAREKFSEQEIIKKDIPLAEIPVENGMKNLISAYPDSDYVKIVKKMENVNVKVERKEKLEAPITPSTDIGKYKVVIDGEVVYEGKLVVKESIEKKSFWDRILEWFHS